METTYKIVRFYYPNGPWTAGKGKRVIERGLTLEEAQKHCQDPKTRKEGEWFDGYQKED